VALSVVTVLALGACGSDDGNGTDASGTETSSASPSESPTESPTDSPTESTSEPEPTPTAEPATGPRLDVSGIKVNIPKGWQQNISSVVVDTALGRVEGMSGAVLLSAVATGGDVLSPQQAEKYFWTRNQEPKGYEKQDDIVMGGLPAGYYTAGDKFYDIHAATVWDDNHVTKVELKFDPRVSDDKQQGLFQSVVATYSSPRMR